MKILDDFFGELKALWVLLSTAFSAINFLVFVGNLNSSFQGDGLAYSMNLLAYLIASLIVGTIESALATIGIRVIGKIADFLRDLLGDLL